MSQNSQKIRHLDPSTPMRRVLSADTLPGNRVRNRMGEELGSIKEIMWTFPSAASPTQS